MLEIVPVPAFNDNYIWIGLNPDVKEVFVVDPGDAKPVSDYLERNQLTLAAILVTHKHADHTGGIPALLRHYPKAAVYAHPKEQLPFVTHPVQDNERFSLAFWPNEFRVIHIPGHTLGHVAYYTKPNLFCGDTLFSAGCGRVFEGTPNQMLTSLEKLAALPAETLIFCGHEYTVNNLRFAALVEPHNKNIVAYAETANDKRTHQKPTLPSTLQTEKLVNPFLRCQESTVQEAAQNKVSQPLKTKTDIFHVLREWKNNL